MTIRFLLLLLVLFAGAAQAHGLYEAYLDHTVLCLDDDSVHVLFDDPPEARVPLDTASLQGQLQGTLRQMLTSSRVNMRAGAPCVDSSSYTVIVVILRTLNPQLFSQYPAGTIGFSTEVQVGSYAEPGFVEQFRELPNLLFSGFVTDVRTDGIQGLEELIHAHGRDLVRDLAVEWWEDNPPAATTSTLPQVLGAGLAFLLAGVVIFGVKRGWRLVPVKSGR